MRLSRRKSNPTSLVGSTGVEVIGNPRGRVRESVVAGFRRPLEFGMSTRGGSAPSVCWRRDDPEKDWPLTDARSLLRFPAPKVERVRDDAGTRLQFLHQLRRKARVDRP